eukprot:TRINITY_DN20774_c0_g1_i1.p2 TRINITY_DN20774_c0_g1~~TRINITY_DN20774_c0_g1_i1.p2  ORF type:complete len:145 (-),score=47.92 TRINITY_DN20774_c0_g1_i1:567-968(-)
MDEVAERRERLKALREAANLVEQDNKKSEEDQPEGEPEPGLRFRNYNPKSEELQEKRAGPVTVPKFEEPVALTPAATDENEDPLVSIAPKKANWDLRRDVAKKLEKLEKRTQRAMIELMQEEEQRRAAAEEEG